MHRYLFKQLLLLTGVLFSACSLNERLTPEEEKEMTVIVYMAAENSLSALATSDLQELVKSAKAIPQTANVVVYVDQAADAENDGMPVIYRITADKGLQKWFTYKEDHCSTDSAVLEQNLQKIVEFFPAEHYGLVLWSHGSSWLPSPLAASEAAGPRRAFGIDNEQNTISNKGHRLSLTGLRWALEAMPHLDYLFFDACYMQAVEVAYELREQTDYIIGSPAEIPGNGAPYDIILPYLVSSRVDEITSHYFAFYEGYDGVVISCVKTAELDALAARVGTLVPTLHKGRHEQELFLVQHYSSFVEDNLYKPDFYDIRSTFYHHLLHGVISEDDYASVSDAISKAVTSFYASKIWTVASSSTFHQMIDADNSCGLSWFVPTAAYGNPDDPKTEGERYFRSYLQCLHGLEWYKAAGWDKTGW